jgi:hypothetical protein
MVARYTLRVSGESTAIHFEPKTPEEQKKTPGGAPDPLATPIIGDSHSVGPVKTAKKRPTKTTT